MSANLAATGDRGSARCSGSRFHRRAVASRDVAAPPAKKVNLMNKIRVTVSGRIQNVGYRAKVIGIAKDFIRHRLSPPFAPETVSVGMGIKRMT